MRSLFYGEVNFLASPLRDVSSSITSATKNFASLYVTSGVKAEKISAIKDLAIFRYRLRICGL
jgi:hypothetical protein